MPWIAGRTINVIFLGLLLAFDLTSACTTPSPTPLPSVPRSDSRIITILKEYDSDDRHYRLTIVDSTGRYEKVFSKRKSLVRNERRRPEQMADVSYHFIRGKDVVTVVKLDMIPSCYSRYNTQNGWIVVRDKRVFYLIEGMNSLMRDVEIEMGKRAKIESTEIKERLACWENHGPDEPTCWDSPILRMIEKMDTSEIIQKKK